MAPYGTSTNADGRLEAFATGTDTALWHIAQSTAGSSTWSHWSSLDGYIVSDPAAGVNAGGRLELFVRGGDNTVWHNRQAQAGSSSWSGWSSLGGESIDAPAVGINADKRLTIFTRSDTGAAEMTQTSPGNWN